MASSSPADEGPLIFTIDNVFLDIAKELPDNSFLEANGVKPGSQNTALTQDLKDVVKKIMDSDFKELSTTVGGCAMNTTRAANFYFQAHPKGPFAQKVLTVGSIGSDEAAETI